MSNQEPERCVYCNGANLTFNESMDIVCEDCGKIQPKSCPYCGNDAVVLSDKENALTECSQCGKPELEKIK